MGKKEFSNAVHRLWLPEECRHGLEEERDAHFAAIKDGLTAALTCREGPFGHEQLMSLIGGFLELKHDFKGQESLFVAQALLQLILDDQAIDQPNHLVLNIRVLSHVLERGAIAGLCVPWRPLYAMMKRLYFPKKRHLHLFPKGELGKVLVGLIKRLRCYFSDDASHEILEELRPFICPHDVSIFEAQGFLSLFLPTHSRVTTSTAEGDQECDYAGEDSLDGSDDEEEGESDGGGPSAVPSDYHWLDECLALLQWIENRPGWSTLFMQLFARAAKDGLGTIDWSPHCRGMFTMFLDLVANTGAALPVGSVAYPMAYQLGLPSECGVFFPSSDHVTTCMRAIARFIVFMMTPGSAALPGLAEMLSYIEPYYHPSNYGGWSVRLAQFARSLCSSFARRVAAERKLRKRLDDPGHEVTPRELELKAVMLSDEDIDKFLGIMLPLLFKSLYSKSGRVGQHSCLSLKTLSQIKPEAVFPELLASIYPDLETVLQTHRTQAALEVLGYTCRPLLWRSRYPSGAEHLLALLNLTLPGIDPNDLVKTHATLKFYSNVLMAVPLHDESGLEEEAELSDTEVKIKQSTAGFADWGIQLLQRVLVLYSLCVEGDNTKQTSMESIIHMPVQQLCSLLFMQADDATYGTLLSHFFSFVTNNYLSNAVKELGKLCCGVVKGSPHRALKLFLPHYHMVLLEEVPVEGAEGLFQAPLRSSRGDTPAVRTKLQLQSLSTNELEWALIMLAQVCRGSGGALVSHKKAISEILECVLGSTVVKKTLKLVTASGKLLRTVLKTLISIYLTEYRSWTDGDDTQSPHWRAWGENPDGEQLCPSWHYPSNEELTWAIELIERYGNGALDALGEMKEAMLALAAESSAKKANDEDDGSAPSLGPHFPSSLRKRLCTELELLTHIQKGARDILVKDAVSADDTWSAASPSWKFFDAERCRVPQLPRIGRAGLVEKAEELGLKFSRTRVARAVLDISQFLVDMECDDTRLLTSVTTFINIFLNYPLGNAITLLLRKKGLASEANFSSDHVNGKSCEVRYMRLARASQFYKNRLIESSFRVELSPLHFELIHLLLQLSVNAYSSVRYAAQEVLHITFRYFMLPSRICGPLVIDYLGNPSSRPEHITGAVYLLHNVLFLRSVLADWTMLEKLFFSVLDRRPSSTSSIQSRLSSLMDAIANVFVRVGIIHDTKRNGKERLKGPWPDLDLVISGEDQLRLQEESRENFALYQKLVQHLVECYSSGLSWVNSLKCASMLTLLVRDDVDLDAGYVGACFSMLLSDVGMLRLTSMACLTKVLSAVKVERPRGVITFDSSGIPGKECIVQRIPKEKARDTALERLTNYDDWEKADFQDKNFFGWNGVSKDAKRYLPLSREEREQWKTRVLGAPLHEAVIARTEDMDMWKEFVTKVTSEHGAQFSTRVATFFKSLFQVAGIALIQRLSDILDTLCGHYSEQSEQALACHILAGSGRGCKHWAYEDVDTLYTQFVVPKVMDAIENSTPECFHTWLSALNYCVYDKDIRRLRWLHEALVNASLNQEESSLLQSRRIKACVAVISEYSWRGMCFGEQLTARLIESTGLLIDRKVVREASANMLAMVLGSSFEGCRAPDTELPTLKGEVSPVESQVALVNEMVKLLDNTNAKIAQFFQEIATKSLQHQNAASGADSVSPTWQEEVRDRVIALKKERAAGRKLVLFWIVYTCRIGGAKVLADYIDRLVPYLFVMRDDDDPELLDLAVSAIGYVANSQMPRERVVSLLPVCYELLHSPTTDWHAKVSVLPFLQVVVFNNILDLGRQELEKLIQVLLAALVDRQLEVRMTASTTLSGVLKFVSDDSYLAGLRESFYQMAETPLPPKRKFSAALLGPQRNATIQALLQRHGGVLGMTALVGMHPYGIPEWLPALLVDLVLHINDPSPIKETVKKAFLEFWRVHQDAWADEQLLFTPEQLSILTELLVAPSYFG